MPWLKDLSLLQLEHTLLEQQNQTVRYCKVKFEVTGSRHPAVGQRLTMIRTCQLIKGQRCLYTSLRDFEAEYAQCEFL